jgi:UDP-3-O-[3-hydroxymyristoyl] glucosamine N-acyltransferase
VIGSDGFGYSKQGEAWVKVPQVGVVEIGNDVEIGANVTIDRARFGRTEIADGVKIDNLVQVAHNVRIGAHTAMAAQVGISGSTRIGRGVQLGGQAGLAGHLHVGDGAVVGAQAGVTKDVEPGAFVVGFPAAPYREYFKWLAETRKVPGLRAKTDGLEERLAALESAGGGPEDGGRR